MRPLLAAVVVTTVTLSAVACSNMGLATSPSAMPTVVTSSSPAGSGGVASTRALAESILAGSAYQITAVDTDARTISGENAQGAFTATYSTADTTFRLAQLNFYPTDPLHPCRSRVEVYNGGSVDSDTFYGIVKTLVGCNARIIVQTRSSTQFPTDPIRILSFQPIQ